MGVCISIHQRGVSGHGHIAVFGPLHVEQNLLSCTGELVKGTGLGDVLKSAGVLMVGITTAFCDVNNIKKARYAGQVMDPV